MIKLKHLANAVRLAIADILHGFDNKNEQVIKMYQDLLRYEERPSERVKILQIINEAKEAIHGKKN